MCRECRAGALRETGEPGCFWGECRATAPTLSILEQVALTLISEASHQWGMVAGMGFVARTRLIYEAIKPFADANNVELDHDLLAALHAFENEVVAMDARGAGTKEPDDDLPPGEGVPR